MTVVKTYPPHGGIDGGCTSAEGVHEKGINLDILLKLRDLLEVNGFEVRVSRDTDRSIHNEGVEGIAAQKSSDMDNRLAIFNESDNAVCISIHQNQFTDSKYSGAQMFYSKNDPRSEKLGESIRRSVTSLLQPENSRELKNDNGSVYILKKAEVPAVIVECGFLSNENEARLLSDSKYQGKMAFAIMCGFLDFENKRNNR